MALHLASFVLGCVALGAGCGRVGFGLLPTEDVGTADAASEEVGEWIAEFSSSGSSFVKGVGVDALGNVTVAGTFQGELSIGRFTESSGPDAISYVASFDPQGEPRWLNIYEGQSFFVAEDIAVQANGSSSTVGYFVETATIGSTLYNAGNRQDTFILDHGSDGSLTGFSHFPGSTGNAQPHSADVLADGTLAVSGTYFGNADFGGGPITTATQDSGFVAVYDETMGLTWASSVANGRVLRIFGTALAANSDVYIVGRFSGTVDFGLASMTALGGDDGFVASFDSTGAFKWAHAFGSTSSDSAYDVALTADGGCVVVGEVTGDADFGAGVLSALGGTDAFIAAYDSGGNLSWAELFGGPGNETGRDLSVNANGDIFVGGFFNGTAVFGGVSLSSAGARDGYLYGLSSTGQALLAKSYGGAGDDLVWGVSADNQGAVLVTGGFQGTAHFGELERSAQGETEAFVYRHVLE